MERLFLLAQADFFVIILNPTIILCNSDNIAARILAIVTIFYFCLFSLRFHLTFITVSDIFITVTVIWRREIAR